MELKPKLKTNLYSLDTLVEKYDRAYWLEGAKCYECPLVMDRPWAKQYLQEYRDMMNGGMTIDDVCQGFNIDNIGDFSDGYHTFNSLYYQRAVLFATIVNQNRDLAWKSLKHEDGEPCFGGGWFIVGVDTPEGSYTYHYETHLWSLFHCKELPVAKHWDGHTDKDVRRLLSLAGMRGWTDDGRLYGVDLGIE